jgi:hypothetical protein
VGAVGSAEGIVYVQVGVGSQLQRRTHSEHGAPSTTQQLRVFVSRLCG